MGSKESKNKYRKKQYEVDKEITKLYRGIGGRPDESYRDFKKRIRSLR